jgi:hypothetical protein
LQKKQRKCATKRKPRAATGTKESKASKKGQMIELLKRPDGVTLQDLMSASGWQAHSVRGFLSGAVSKRMGLQVDSTKRDNGQRVYRIA